MADELERALDRGRDPANGPNTSSAGFVGEQIPDERPVRSIVLASSGAEGPAAVRGRAGMVSPQWAGKSEPEGEPIPRWGIGVPPDPLLRSPVASSERGRVLIGYEPREIPGRG